MTKLGDITYRVSTWNPTRAPGADKFDYIDLSAVDNESKSIVAPSRIAPFDAPSRARQVVSAGDVLVSTVRPNLNAVATVPPALHGATASTGFTVLRPTTRLDGQYLFHWVRSQKFVADMVSKASGASYPAVSDRIVKDSSIPLPHIDEQRRIAAILDQADASRAKRRQALAHLDDLTQSIFLDMFGDPVENPLGLPTRALSEWVTPDSPITYGILKPGDDLPDGVPYIRVVDIRDGAILTARVRRTSGEIAAAYERSKVAAGDLVISIRGHVGRIGMVPSELQDANITQDSARIRLPSEVRDYVRAALETDSMAHWMARRTKGAAVRGLNLGDLRLAPVPVPPESEVREFSKSADHVRTQRRLAVMQGECAQQMFASLQSRAFSGQL